MRKAVVPVRTAGKSTRKKVLSSSLNRVRRGGIRSVVVVVAWSDVDDFDNVLK